MPIEGTWPRVWLRARQSGEGLEITEISKSFPSNATLFTRAWDLEFGRVAAAFCVTGYCGGYGDPSPDAMNELYVSTDGGLGWERLPSVPPNSFVAATLGRSVVVGTFGGVQPTQAYRMWPDGGDVAPPNGASSPITVGGMLAWQSEDGAIFDAAGGVLYAAPALAAPALPDDCVRERRTPARDSCYSVVRGEHPELIWWIPLPRDSNGTGYVSEVGRDGTLGRTVKHSGMDLHVIGRVDKDRVIVRRYFPPEGGIGATYLLDMADGSFHEVRGLRRAGQGRDTDDIDAYPFAVVRGPSARVSTGGSCLNVRERPAVDAPIPACFGDDVLLWVAGSPESINGSEWLPVRTPDGRSGYASTAFLVR